MKLKIITTPKSITVSDDNGNKLSVVKTTTEILFTSTVMDAKVTTPIHNLQKEIKNVILNPKDNRDNYRVRFDKLNKEIAQLEAHTFLSLLKRIQKMEIQKA